MKPLATGDAASGEVHAALRDIAPVLVASFPIGMLFGALAVGKGLSVAEAGLMSLLVYAGGAQFAALQLWAYPVPVFPLAVSAFLVNARHVLLGTSLNPKLARFSFAQRLLGFYFLTDETWALAERRALSRPITPSYWFALGAPLPLVWIASTLLGAWLGSLLGDPARFGADFVFSALFIGLIAGFWKGPRSLFTIAASAATAALVYLLAGSPWHVPAGAAAGIAAAYFTAPSQADP